MKIQRNQRRLVAAAVTAALTLGLAGGAWAQQPSDTTGGSTSDDTSAGNDNGGGMPQIQHQGDVAFVSGGVGSDESKALQGARTRWPLALRFTGPGSDSSPTCMCRSSTRTALTCCSTTSRGPYMLVKLRPGRYTVHARYKSDDQQKAVTIPATGSAKSAFYWNQYGEPAPARSVAQTAVRLADNEATGCSRGFFSF